MKKITIVLFALMIFSVGFLSGCETSEYSSYDNENNINVPVFHIVTYRVTGSADSVSVTYENYDGGTSQRSKVYLPWERQLFSMKTGDFVYISAQNNGEYGSVTTEIYVDGELFKTSTSIGAYVIATSSGTL